MSPIHRPLALDHEGCHSAPTHSKHPFIGTAQKASKLGGHVLRRRWSASDALHVDGQRIAPLQFQFRVEKVNRRISQELVKVGHAVVRLCCHHCCNGLQCKCKVGGGGVKFDTATHVLSVSTKAAIVVYWVACRVVCNGVCSGVCSGVLLRCVPVSTWRRR